MNNKLIIITIGLFVLFLTSCKDKFLEITDPNQPSSTTFFNSVANAQYAVNGIYAEVHDEELWFGEIFYILNYSTGEMQYIHPEDRYVAFNDYSYTATNTLITGNYKGFYRMIVRANDALNGLYEMKKSGKFAKDSVTIANMMGQCYFLKGFAYSYLVRMYGQAMPTSPDYNPVTTPGVVIADTFVTARESLYKDRNPCGEVYHEVLKDFQMAEKLLPTTWLLSEAGKATKGAAQAYLGETYMYLKDYANAAANFDKVVHSEANYKLVRNFYDNFDTKHINNSESIFELGFNNTTIGYFGTYVFRLLALQSWGTSKARLDAVQKFSSSVVITPEALADSARVANGVYGNANKLKFYQVRDYVNTHGLVGQSFSTANDFVNAISLPYNPRNTDSSFVNGLRQYIAMVSPRDNRLLATFYRPGIDSIWTFDPNPDHPVKWKRGVFGYQDYGMKKYIPDSIEVEAADLAGFGNNGGVTMNFRLMRLDDVYLYYAEALHNLEGHDAEAIEYINKLVRRANYKTDDDHSTDLNPSNIDAEIRNQTFMETALEGKWWFHVRRWNRGSIEFKKYGFTKGRDECLPIPHGEIDSNPAIKHQNNGF